VRLTDDPERSEQNPVLFPTPTGDLWLLYTAQRAGNQDTAEVRRRVSTDAGRRWGEVETLFPADERGGVFVRQPLVVTGSGRWLLPIFRCVTVPGEPWAGDADTSAVLVSDDRGATWREVPVPDSVGCVHMSVVDLGGGELSAVFRSRWADHVHTSRSSDDGDSWTAPVPTQLPNNNSSIQQLRLDDGRLGLVYNSSSRLDATQRRVSLYDEIDEHGVVEGAAPAAVAVADDGPSGEPGRRRAFWGAPRAPMTLAFSSDRGRTWQVAGNLDEGDGYCLTNNSRDGLNRELSYPAIHQTSDGALHLSYTYHRQTIKYVRVPSTWTQGRA
jgi:predicted neuraminidase